MHNKELISEEEILRRANQVKEMLKQKKLINAKSMADLLNRLVSIEQHDINLSL